MRRREFITLVGGATAAWPLGARAQQLDRMRRIGILLPAAADDAVFQTRVGAFLQELQSLGWSIGRNVRIDTRWASSNASEIRKQASELATLAPDVILAHGAATPPTNVMNSRRLIRSPRPRDRERLPEFVGRVLWQF